MRFCSAASAGSSMSIWPNALPPMFSVFADRMLTIVLHLTVMSEMTGAPDSSPVNARRSVFSAICSPSPDDGSMRRLAVSDCGLRNTSWTLPTSLISPPLITATRLQICSTTRISCVMTTMVTPSFSLSSFSSARMERVVMGSSALVASSQRMISGSEASARAMATRCFWPPESCEG